MSTDTTTIRAGKRLDPADDGSAWGRVGRWLHARLVRKTASVRYIPEVDGLRFVAIALVLVYHLSGYLDTYFPFHPGPRAYLLGRIAGHGHYGVELFFIISGFILAIPFAAHRLCGAPKVSLRAFLMRRVSRLEPPYILSMLALAAMVLVMGKAPAGTIAAHLLASLGYVHNVVYRTGSLINTVAWSLEIEIQFYLLAPLLSAAFFSIRKPGVRRAVLALTALGMVALQASPLLRPLPTTLLNYLQFFLLGFLAADLYLTDWAAAPRAGRGWDVAWLAAWPLMLAAAEAPLRVGMFAFPAAAGLLFAASLRGRVGRWVLSRPWVAIAGGMCYSTYLLHYPVISAVERAGAGKIPVPAAYPAALLLHLVVVAAPLVLVCGGFFVLVERPCMDPRWPSRARQWLAARAPGKAARRIFVGALPIRAATARELEERSAQVAAPGSGHSHG